MASVAKLVKAASDNGELVQDQFNQQQWWLIKSILTRDDESVNSIAKVIIGTLPTGVHSQRGVQKLVRIELGQGISFISVRTDLRCRNDQVDIYQKAVRNYLNKLKAELVDYFNNNR